MAPGHVGEIAVSGPHLADGYWRAESETEATFPVVEDSGRRELRTGDLGFFWDDELYVFDRLKDLIIVRGCNIFPHDVEAVCAEAGDENLVPGGIVALGVDVDGAEALTVVAEVRRSSRRTLDAVAVGKTLRRAVFEQLGASLSAVVFVPHGAIPKTSSGNLQRRKVERLMESGELNVLAQVGRRVEGTPTVLV